MKIEFSSQRTEMLSFLTTNMAVVTSRANQQYSARLSTLWWLFASCTAWARREAVCCLFSSQRKSIYIYTNWVSYSNRFQRTRDVFKAPWPYVHRIDGDTPNARLGGGGEGGWW